MVRTRGLQYPTLPPLRRNERLRARTITRAIRTRNDTGKGTTRSRKPKMRRHTFASTPERPSLCADGRVRRAALSARHRAGGIPGALSAGENHAGAERSRGDAGPGAAGGASYYAHCTALDKCIGELMATLAETEVAKRRSWWFTSDHGEIAGRAWVSAHDETGALERIGACAVPAALSGGSQSPGTRRQHADYYFRHPADLAGAGVGQDSQDVEARISPGDRSGGEADKRAALYIGNCAVRAARFCANIAHSHEPLHLRARLDGPWLLFDDEKDRIRWTTWRPKEEGRGLQKDLDGRCRAS